MSRTKTPGSEQRTLTRRVPTGAYVAILTKLMVRRWEKLAEHKRLMGNTYIEVKVSPEEAEYIAIDLAIARVEAGQ